MSVIVVVDIYQKEVTESTYEIVALGKELATGLGVPLKALFIGSGLSGYANGFGSADELIFVEDGQVENFNGDIWSQVISGVTKKHGAKVVLCASSSRSADYSAQVAVSLGGTHVGFCRDATVSDGKVKTTSLLFGGKVVLESSSIDAPLVLDIAPGTRKIDQGKVDGSPATVNESLSEFSSGSKVMFKAMHIPDSSDVDITTQDILVSIGRGIQDEGNIELAQELADALGGVVSASRPIVDQGWLPETRQVGKSGKTVKPKLYLALGISGAPEHIEGMIGAEIIIAINTDEKAPIFDVAHYGVVADVLDFLPELTEKLE